MFALSRDHFRLLLRSDAGVLLALALLAAALTWNVTNSSQRAEKLLAAEAALIVLCIPTIAAATLAAEREHRTLTMLIGAIHPLRIVLAALLTTLLIPAIVIVVGSAMGLYLARH